MKTILYTKEYNEISSERNNIEVYDIYANDWGVLQYGIKFNEYNSLYDFYNITRGKIITGLTNEKINRVLNYAIEYEVDLFKKHKRL